MTYVLIFTILGIILCILGGIYIVCSLITITLNKLLSTSKFSNEFIEFLNYKMNNKSEKENNK